MNKPHPGPVAAFPGDVPLRLWWAHGVACAIHPGHSSINGYCRIPEGHPWSGYKLYEHDPHYDLDEERALDEQEAGHVALAEAVGREPLPFDREAWRILRRKVIDADLHGRPGEPGLEDLIDVHWGLNYGPDEQGWVGFDTAHAGDWWPPEELKRLGVTLRDGTYGLGDDHHRGDPRTEVWTMQRLVVETEHMARQVAEVAELAQAVSGESGRA